MNIDDFFANLIWPVFLESSFKLGFVTSLGGVSPCHAIVHFRALQFDWYMYKKKAKTNLLFCLLLAPKGEWGGGGLLKSRVFFIKRPPFGWTQNTKQKITMPHLIIDPKYRLQYMPNNETGKKNQHY